MPGSAAAHKRFRYLLIAALVAGAQPAPAQDSVGCAQDAVAETVSPDLAAHPHVRAAVEMLREWIRYRMEWIGPPGLSLAVTYRGRLVWAEGFGLADVGRGRRAGPETVYGGASLTKPVTALAILQLRDAGRLSLDDPVSRYLPWFEAADSPPSGESARPITIRDLLSHSSGLESDGPTHHWSDFRFPEAEDIRKALVTGERPFPPGAVFKYSNWGFHLLGEVVKAVSGQDYAAYVTGRILAPLGMCASTVVATPNLPALAVGYGRALPGQTERPMMPFSDVRALRPAAGLFTTAPDLARLMAFVSSDLDSEILGLEPATVAEMSSLHIMWPDSAGGYGLGLMLPGGPKPLIGHVSKMNGYAATFVADPESGVGVATLGNALDAELYPGGRLSIADQVREWMTQPILVATQATSAPPAGWSRSPLRGTYRAIWGDFQVAAYLDSLVIFDPLHPPAADRLTRLVPLGAGRFRAPGRGDGVLAPGTSVRFVKPNERVGFRLMLPATYADRVTVAEPSRRPD